MKILFIYPNNDGIGTIPLGIAIISARLKDDGHEVFLFDSTFISTKDTTIKDRREEVGSHVKTDMKSYIKRYDIPPETAFAEMITAVRPDIIALSAVSYNFPEGLKYLQIAKNCKNMKQKHKYLTIVGGTHASVAPDKTIEHDCVDMICIGEGELAMSELCGKLQNGQDYTNVKNIWIKQNGRILKNPPREFANLNELPFPDLASFDDSHFYKPFVGRVYRIAHIELSRGCPFKCTYCVNQYYQDTYKGLGNYRREKSIERGIAELKHVKEKYNVNMLKF